MNQKTRIAMMKLDCLPSRPSLQENSSEFVLQRQTNTITGNFASLKRHNITANPFSTLNIYQFRIVADILELSRRNSILVLVLSITKFVKKKGLLTYSFQPRWNAERIQDRGQQLEDPDESRQS